MFKKLEAPVNFCNSLIMYYVLGKIFRKVITKDK